MKLDLRKTLLAGTALVAVGAFVAPLAVTPAYAADEISVDADDSGSFDADELATSPFNWGANTNGTAAAAEATDSHDLQVNGSATVTLADGDTIGDGDDTVAAITASVTGQTLTFTNTEDDTDATITIDGDIDVGSLDAMNIAVTAIDSVDASTETITIDVNGDIDLGTGTITLTGNDDTDDNTVTLLVSGDVTSGTITLDDELAGNGGGTTTITFDGTAAGQTVTSAIDAGDADDGAIVVTNTHADGVTFSGVIGATSVGSITVNNDGNDQFVTFQADVTTTNGISLGDNSGTDTVTATFDSSAGDMTVTGAIAGGGAADTVALVVSGSNTVTQATASTSNLDTLTVSGSGTILDSAADLTVGATTIGSGATLLNSAGTLTTDSTVAGTLQITGGAVTGAVDGSSAGVGTLNVDEDVTVTGAIGGTASLAAIDVATTKTLTATDEVAATTVTLNGTGALSMTAGYDLTANVVAAADGDGTLTITNGGGATTAITGNVGTSSASVGALTMASHADADTVTTTGNLYVDAITLGQDDTLQFLGTSAQVVSGTIDSDVAGRGDLVIGDGTTTSNVTFLGVIGATTLNDITVNEEATARFSADAEIAGNLDVDGTMRIDEGANVTVGDVVAGAAEGTLQVVLGKTAANADNSATLTSGAAADFDQFDNSEANTMSLSALKGTGVFSSGDEFLVIDGTGALTNAPAAGGEAIADNFALFNVYALDGSDAAVALAGADASDIVLELRAVSTASVTATGNNAAAADAMLAVSNAQYQAADSNLQAVYDNVVGASSSTIDELVESVQPTADNGHIVGALTVSNQSLSLTSQRMAELRHGHDTGMAAGNSAQGLRVWAQAFGQSGDQDSRDGIDGYDTDTYGLAAGIDTANLSENGIVGLAFSYGDTDVESDNANTTDTEIDSYQFTLYGDYDLDETTYLNGMVAYAHQSVDTTRHNVGGVAGLNANGDFDADLFQIQAELGRDYTYDQTTVTPNVMANYVYYDADDYTETGAGDAGLVVDNGDVSVFELGLGVDASWEFDDNAGGKVVPEVRVGYRYDLIGDDVETSSRFIGGTTAFKTDGMDPAQGTLELGAGLKYYTVNNWELSANYDFEAKEDYDSHSGYLRAGYKF